MFRIFCTKFRQIILPYFWTLDSETASIKMTRIAYGIFKIIKKEKKK